MDDQGVFRTFPLHLPNGLDVRQGFDVTHRASNLSDDEIVVVFGSQNLNAALDLVGDVGNDLDGFAQVLSTTLLVNDALVNAARGDVVGLRGFHIQEPLVVAQIKVSLRPIHRDVTFSVLVRIQRARIHVDVGVQLLDGHFVPSCLQQFRQRSTDNALAKAAAHTSRHKNVAAVAPTCEGVVGGRKRWQRHVP